MNQVISPELNSSLNQPTNLIINFRKINRVLTCLTVAAVVLYLISANNLAVKGFILKDAKNKMNDLQQENLNLEIKTMTLSSYQYLRGKIAELKLVPGANARYLTIVAPVVAKR